MLFHLSSRCACPWSVVVTQLGTPSQRARIFLLLRRLLDAPMSRAGPGRALALALLLLFGVVAAEAVSGWTWPSAPSALTSRWRSHFGATKKEDCCTVFNVRVARGMRAGCACCG
jgi:hypothetical protein